MAYLGYKNITYRKYMREQARVRKWKAEQKKESEVKPTKKEST